jgi:hypothetical protein
MTGAVGRRKTPSFRVKPGAFSARGDCDLLSCWRSNSSAFPVNPVTLDQTFPAQNVPHARGALRSSSYGPTVLLPWLAIFLVAVLATQRIWEPGALAGHSAWYDLVRMVVFDAAIRAGDWFPTWSADFYHGYGSPLFQFYAPLVYYFTEIPMLAGADVATALKVTQVAALLASGLAMYALATRHLSRWAACFGAILYMVAPYRFVDLYVRHALAEHCAFVWLPLIVLGTERFVSERSGQGLALGTAAIAGLIFTHNIMALIGLPFCVVAGFVLGARSFGRPAFFRAGVPAVLGIGLTTFFWWPALVGRASTHGPEELTEGFFDVHRNFATLARLLSSTWGFGGSAEAAEDTMSVQVGAVHLAVGGAALLLLLWRGRGREEVAGKRFRWLVVGVTTLTLAVFMCHAVSQPVWHAFPLLEYVQFPWRFLGLAVFGGALCGAALFDRVGETCAPWKLAIFGTGMLILMAAYSPYCREAWFLAVDGQKSELVRVRAGLLNAGLATGRLLPLPEVLTLETVRDSGERATSVDDFLPREVREKPSTPPSELVAVRSGEILRWTYLGPNHYRGEFALPEAGVVELRQFYFPGWTAWLDKWPVTVAPSGEMALVSCAVPAGNHAVEFFYDALPQRHTGLAITLLAGGVLVVAVGRFSIEKRAAAE